MTLISSNGYTQDSIENLAVEKVNKDFIPSDIILPEPQIIQKDNIQLYAWTIEGYATILQLFNGYSLWADSHTEQEKVISLWKLRLDLCRQEKKLEVNSLNLALEDRDKIYGIWYQEQKDQKKQEVRKMIKTILVSTGIGIVCIAVGIPIGFMMAK